MDMNAGLTRPTLKALVLAGCASLFLAGCASNPQVADNVTIQPDYGEYVERVFRYQNGVENQVIQLKVYDVEVDADHARAIYAAEDHMLTACSSLNELVLMNSEGRHPG